MLTARGQRPADRTEHIRRRLPAAPRFRASTQLVIETVSVKDKNGKPIEGLTAKDFTVTEDGAPQTISFFEYQKLQEPAREASTADGAAE